MAAAVLFIVTFVLGIAAVLGGVGGGVLFVPIIGGFFPFHLDFVRGAGLRAALSGALAALPGLLKKGMADLRLAIPVAPHCILSLRNWRRRNDSGLRFRQMSSRQHWEQLF